MTPPITLAKLAAAATSPAILHLSRKPKQALPATAVTPSIANTTIVATPATTTSSTHTTSTPSTSVTSDTITTLSTTTPTTTVAAVVTTTTTSTSPKLRPSAAGGVAGHATVSHTGGDEDGRHRRQSSLPVAAGVGYPRPRKQAEDEDDQSWAESSGFPSGFTRDRSVIPARPLPAPNIVFAPGVSYVHRRRFSTNSMPDDQRRTKAHAVPNPLPLKAAKRLAAAAAAAGGTQNGTGTDSKVPAGLIRSVTALPGSLTSSTNNKTVSVDMTPPAATAPVSTAALLGITPATPTPLASPAIDTKSIATAALPGIMVVASRTSTASPATGASPAVSSSSSSSSASSSRERKKSEIKAPDWSRLDMSGSLNWLMVPAHFFTYVQTAIRPHALQSLLGGGSFKSWLAISSSTGLHYRGKSTILVDRAMQDYLGATEVSEHLVSNSRMVCEETNTGSQIGFAYPGFDGQYFDVGKKAVVEVRRFFAAAGILSFSSDEWRGALGSKCVAKELMQSSPDVSALYEAGRSVEAKTWTLEATKSILHNLCLAEYVRAHPELSDGTLLNWSDMRATMGPPNQRHLKAWDDTQYLWNPSKKQIETLVCHWEGRLKEKKAPDLKQSLKVRLILPNLRWIAFYRTLVMLRAERLDTLVNATKAWLGNTLFLQSSPALC